MTADLKESAGRTQSGNITKAGSVTLRWALCQAAVTLCHCDARQEAIRQRLIKRIGKAKANVAMGRRLLRTLYAMVRDQKPYRCEQPIDRTTRLNKARAARTTEQKLLSGTGSPSENSWRNQPPKEEILGKKEDEFLGEGCGGSFSTRHASERVASRR